jgi:hypothetical protein
MAELAPVDLHKGECPVAEHAPVELDLGGDPFVDDGRLSGPATVHGIQSGRELYNRRNRRRLVLLSCSNLMLVCQVFRVSVRNQPTATATIYRISIESYTIGGTGGGIFLVLFQTDIRFTSFENISSKSTKSDQEDMSNINRSCNLFDQELYE